MSDLSIRFDDYEDDGIFEARTPGFSGQSERQKNPDKMVRAIKIIFVILASCILLEFLFYKFIVPSTGTPKVQVTGAESYTPEEVVGLLSSMNARNWYEFNAESAVSILASVSAFDSVSVKKVFPDRIYVNVEERQVVAVTFITVNDRTQAVQVDKNGVLFPVSKDGIRSDIPIISGIPVEHLSEGMRIPAKYRGLIDQIADIHAHNPKYLAGISEICVIPKEYGNYELVLIPAKSKVRVLTDRTLNEDALNYMMVVLDVVDSNEPDVSEIDLRYGSVSYRRK